MTATVSSGRAAAPWHLWVVGVLLLLRSRHAATAFLVSFLGAIVSFAYQFTLDLPPALQDTLTLTMPLVIIILIVAQWYYAKRMTDAGILG